MKSLSQEREIITMANALRLTGPNAVQSILNLCSAKIAMWIQTHGPVQSIWELERLVRRKLNLEIHEIWNDNDLERVIRDYVEEGDYVFASLKHDLDATTFATLIRRKSPNPNSEERYVAVIDCRGDKGSRRFFTRWHEIAHLLTLYKQMLLPLHRSTIEKDPTEKLMDIIAGEIGFYGPLFEPFLAAEIRKTGRLTFAVVENVRSQFCPDASFQATLNASVAKLNSPAILLEIGMGYKKTEQRQLDSLQMNLIPAASPKSQLRVLNSTPNAIARSIGFRIPRNIRIPKHSILKATFNRVDEIPSLIGEGIENLNSWGHSGGLTLPHQEISVQAQKIHDKVFAIVLAV